MTMHDASDIRNGDQLKYLSSFKATYTCNDRCLLFLGNNGGHPWGAAW